MTTAAPAKPSTNTVLKATLGSDGKFKYSLPAREESKLTNAYHLCLKLSLVKELEEHAKNAATSLNVLSRALSDSVQ